MDDRASRNDDRDFASVMSGNGQDKRRDVRDTGQRADPQDRADDAARDPAKTTAKAAEKTAATPADRTADATDKPATSEDAPRDGTRAEDGTELGAGDTPRRQVTIPELPARRGAGTAPAVDAAMDQSAGTDMPRATSDTATTEIGLTGAARAPAEGETDAQPALPRASDATVQAASRTVAGPAPQQPQALATGAIVLPQSAGLTPDADTPEAGATAQPDADAGAETSPRHAGLANAETRVPAQAAPAIQAAQARQVPRMAAQEVGEDRAARNAREPIARAVETVAATTAPTPQVTAAQTSAAAGMAVLQPAAKDALASKDKADSAFALEGETDSLRFDLRGSSGTGSTQHGSTVSALARNDVARGVAMQIGDMVRAKPDRPVDISLSPEELGRVRLSISTGEGGVTLHVLAERPETLELMRRHADLLARELAGLGFGSIDLAFGQGRDPGDGDGDDRADGPKRDRLGAPDETTAAPTTEDGTVTRLMLNASGGLDIRI